MGSSCEVPKCIHDGLRTYTTQTHGHRTELRVTCDECGALLWGWDRADHETQLHKFYYDDVYELLYTRKGRMVLVKEALAARGWPVPDLWERTNAS